MRVKVIASSPLNNIYRGMEGELVGNVFIRLDDGRVVSLKVESVEFPEVISLRAFKQSVDEALNTGDGSYRP